MATVTFQDLKAKAKEKHLKLDLTLLRLAFDYAEQAHRNQARKSGEPYIVHPAKTALTLMDYKLDQATILAGLLHDVPEDTDESIHEIKKNFGDEVAFLVDGVTKLGIIKYRGLERYIENLRKMFIAMSADIRVMLVKFADRLHNLETLDALPPDKQRRIALETLEIYAPIANRLGIGELKGQLEDHAFRYVYPKEYARVNELFTSVYRKRADYADKIQKIIRKELVTEGVIPIDIHGRTKHLYSLYKKLERHDNDITKIHDLIALRIIVRDVKDCYATLGVIHKLWKPLPGRIKDYIATPKPNGYQSIHTTVFCEGGQVVEFQIRDEQMHDLAEHGIAAHWHYAEAGKQSAIPPKKLEWINQLLDWQKQLHNHRQYLETLKIDTFQNRIFVFTPKGDVIDLPEDSTPVDFAYAIHSDLGDRCAGAKINDRIANLKTHLRNGDVCEIIIDKKRKKPNRDWLDFAKTNAARSHIRNAIKR